MRTLVQAARRPLFGRAFGGWCMRVLCEFVGVETDLRVGWVLAEVPTVSTPHPTRIARHHPPTVCGMAGPRLEASGAVLRVCRWAACPLVVCSFCGIVHDVRSCSSSR